ncbi:tetratricopeptide repeat protein [Bacillus sp. S/N-304-OC-R1]|uniref:tetratricopeptide repeat protein n=1 Tax=Bacillus sp. S/N-304-OC-R1 TaxID=2758034 RepID=UPI001C8EB038|nr:tetratricopeptide repeat protein [Bacillus sp. S/N-304-OC-R1]MBY0123457.1 hypothetical protein [Bacillus sp. S/N-304-OC-R1]
MIEEQSEITFFNEIEENYPVNQWKINGVDVWPLIRIVIGFRLVTTSRPFSSQVYDKSDHKLPRLSTLLKKNGDVDVFVLFDSFTRVKLNDCWYNRLSGPFNEEIRRMGFNVVNLEFSSHNIERFPVFDESYSITNQINYIQESQEICNNNNLERFNEVKREFLIKFGEDFDFPTYEYLYNETSHIQKLSRMFEMLFIKKKTKLGFLINYYQKNSYAFILAARRVGIPTIDIQHGNHRDYYYHRWSNTPEKGYNILPNFFWCWDKDSATNINEWALQTNVHKAINGGNPWIELWKDGSRPFVKKYESIIKKFINDKKTNILVTLQPLYGFTNWDENIPSWLLEAIEKSPKNWRWFIRYHPSMLGIYRNEMENCESILSKLIETGKVETKQATSVPIMAILRNVDIHITGFSTSGIEAMHLGIPTITIHDQAKLFYNNLYNLGWALHAKNTDEILNGIQFLTLKNIRDQLPLYESENIGLNKGLEMVFENDNEAWGGNDCINLMDQEMYFADGLYEQITTVCPNQFKDKDSFIVGRSYELLGQTENAAKYYRIFLKKSIEAHEQTKINMNQLLLIDKFYYKKNMSFEKELLEGYIEVLINKHENLRSSLFINIFINNDDNIQINKWKDHTGENLDAIYFSGRTLLKYGDIEQGTCVLNKYMEMLSEPNNKLQGLTLQRSYRVNAHFCLGEAYFNLNKYENAKYHFNQCNKLIRGEHGKATEYLKALNNNN